MVNWGFDLDEVLCDFSGPYLDVVNEFFGLSLRIDDLTDYYVDKVLNIDPKDIQPVLDIMGEYEKIVTLPLILDGITTLKKIKKLGCDVYIVTARETKMKEATEIWLRNIPHDGLYLTNHESKLDTVKKLKLSYFIEDNLKYANPIAEAGIKVFCPRYPWNINKKLHPNISLLNNTSEILGMLDEHGNIR